MSENPMTRHRSNRTGGFYPMPAWLKHPSAAAFARANLLALSAYDAPLRWLSNSRCDRFLSAAAKRGGRLVAVIVHATREDVQRASESGEALWSDPTERNSERVGVSVDALSFSWYNPEGQAFFVRLVDGGDESTRREFDAVAAEGEGGPTRG